MSENCSKFKTTDQLSVLLIEPFYAGSHKQLIEFLTNLLQQSEINYDLVTLPGKKWHWRARTGALFMSKAISRTAKYHTIFCSSTLNLAELLALRPDLQASKKIIYFHENQFIYPRQSDKDRDFQYGYNTIISALVADLVVFNSFYNRQTFLDNILKHLRKQPDFRIHGLKEEIEPKTSVIYFPITIAPKKSVKNYDILHIVWPHRWEHDKDPELFFRVLFQLQNEGLQFRLSVLGESYTDPMKIFPEAQSKLSERIVHFGRLESRHEYQQALLDAHVVVSTARHEFFGVAMLEAVCCGCLPLAPNDLVYPEIFPKEYLYNTEPQLFKKLKSFSLNPDRVGKVLQSFPIQLSQFTALELSEKFIKLFK